MYIWPDLNLYTLTSLLSWVPPCSMWIADESILDQSLDVAEYVPPTSEQEMAYADNT